MTELDRSQYFGNFVFDVEKFEFSEKDRLLIHKLAEILKNPSWSQISASIDGDIVQQMNLIKKTAYWFCDTIENGTNSALQKEKIIAPVGSVNLLSKMMAAAQTNSSRPKQGFRYDNDLKRLAVYHRILSGPMGYKSLQLNLKGCFPSISTTNQYIHRSDHAIIEGELRTDELLVYLKERNLPMMVALSEDATRVQNRVHWTQSSMIHEATKL